MFEILTSRQTHFIESVLKLSYIIAHFVHELLHCVFGDDDTEIFHVSEMRIGMNEFDHLILSLLKQQQEGPEKFRPEWGFKT